MTAFEEIGADELIFNPAVSDPAEIDLGIDDLLFHGRQSTTHGIVAPTLRKASD
jgi:hypothetical protein